ncbi:MAG: hypothetical protein KDC67_05905 [Ignavibacteriae bacterium]|nr:hypothetical protein [Ignavibacteriota bacterium]
MKKLNLKFAKDYLSRDEMRQITGGSGGSGGCWCSCPGCHTGGYCLPAGCACRSDSDCIMGYCSRGVNDLFGVC